jgi:hypothetical protein
VAEHPTPYAETNALIWVSQEDEDAARDALADFSPGELTALAANAEALSDLARTMLREKARDVPDDVDGEAADKVMSRLKGVDG